ncbi:DUF2213 domain-containing protein [Pandoraea terrigena]|uniref:DUF2213 domain-containing protein n=1 Tax=Pandoraea terrigena TaxID=2508292 RepID=A0A5E4V5J1_9BURK|nr:DUF2213 domain-containing protein [Pandoraea terrigena]VVE07371.1 hypothetical protein PTE31013_02459 [Pandoraea terrigena]
MPIKPELIAMDRESVRTVDKDGRLHVSETNISKAGVNPYWGREIPGYEGLGLDPDTIYQVFRPPEELEKAAATFNNIPLLAKHIHVSSEKPEKDKVIGTVGSNARFDGEYLKNSLAVWDQAYIDRIDDDSQRELSSAYHYTAVKKKGVYHGQPYDLVMTDLHGNHVSTVVEGRAGPDVLVADSQLINPEKVASVKLNHAQKKALSARLTQALTARNKTKALIAKDGMIDAEAVEDLLINALAETQGGETAQDDADPGKKDPDDTDGKRSDRGTAADEDDKFAKLLAGLKKVIADCEGGGEDEDIDNGEGEDEGEENGEKPDGDKPAKDNASTATPAEMTRKTEPAKGAMDAKTIRKNVTKEVTEAIQGRFRAASEVKPLTGDIDAMAFDSAEDVYAYAIKAAGKDPAQYDRAAYKGMAHVLVDAAKTPTRTPIIAADAANAEKSLTEQFPGLASIKQR